MFDQELLEKWLDENQMARVMALIVSSEVFEGTTEDSMLFMAEWIMSGAEDMDEAEYELDDEEHVSFEMLCVTCGIEVTRSLPVGQQTDVECFNCGTIYKFTIGEPSGTLDIPTFGNADEETRISAAKQLLQGTSAWVASKNVNEVRETTMANRSMPGTGDWASGTNPFHGKEHPDREFAPEK